MKRVAVYFRDFSRRSMFPAAIALAVFGSPAMAQGDPINECFGKVLDHAGASQIPGDLLVLRSQVFPVSGYASAQGLSDDRIPDRVVRQMVVQLTPLYQKCVNDSYAESAELLQHFLSSQ